MSQYLTTNHDTDRINFYLNDTNAASINSMPENHANPEQHESSQAITTPSNIEMNTYVQLEMDNNNHACIPRVCRFCVARITLNNNDNSSVILGVKLDASKRSIRTVDIPLKNNSADLNLNYNIAYPHFLKKDTNFIYFYVQKRKKLKNRTILGFKTLAFTAIDLASILQKSFTNDMPLFYFNTKIPTILNNANLQNLTSSTDSQHVIGSLKILSLTSTPLDSIDLENNFHFNRAGSNLGKQSMDTGEELLIDEYELENIESLKEDTKSGFISESDLENETLKCKVEKATSSQNPKKFTSKIMSFIKKLRNENLMAQNEIGQHDDAEEDEEGDYDYEYDSIEQVSDYDNSESDDSNADLYSIVSTRKPKLEPFFKNNSNPDLRSLNSDGLLLNIKTEKPEDKIHKPVFMSFDTTVPKKSLKKNRSSSLNNSFQEKNATTMSKLSAATETTEKKQSEICSFFFIESEPLKSLIETKLNQHACNFFIDLKSDIKTLLELITKLNLTNNGIELVIIGSDLFFNEFLKSFIQFLKFHSKILNIFFIPSFKSESTVGDMLAKFSIAYSTLFTDSFWTSLAPCELVDNSEQVLDRILSYLDTCRSNQYKKLTFQVGQLNVNDDLEKSIPFIAEIKIDLLVRSCCEEPVKAANERKSTLVTSNSLPQFFNSITASNSLLLNATPSVDSSYMASMEADNELDLQLDYWRMERISTVMSNSENYNSDEYSAQPNGGNANRECTMTSKSKIKERSISGQFQSILVYRKPVSCDSQNKNKNFDKFLGKNFQSGINCAKSHASSNNVNKTTQEFLSLDYVLREKKQKMRLTARKSSIKTNHKEINKISKLNLRQLDSRFFTINMDGIEILNVNSIEVSCNYENKYLQLNIIIP